MTAILGLLLSKSSEVVLGDPFRSRSPSRYSECDGSTGAGGESRGARCQTECQLSCHYSNLKWSVVTRTRRRADSDDSSSESGGGSEVPEFDNRGGRRLRQTCRKRAGADAPRRSPTRHRCSPICCTLPHHRRQCRQQLRRRRPANAVSHRRSTNTCNTLRSLTIAPHSRARRI